MSRRRAQLSVLLHRSDDPEIRRKAAVDFANWSASRIGGVAACGARWDLADTAGDEIGRSLAAFVKHVLTKDLRADDNHVRVRYGMNEAFGL